MIWTLGGFAVLLFAFLTVPRRRCDRFWRGERVTDQLAAVRAEVEKLRDEADVVADRAVISGAGWARQWTA